MEVARVGDGLVQGVKVIGVFLGNCVLILSWPLLYLGSVLLEEWPPAILQRFLSSDPGHDIQGTSNFHNNDLDFELGELRMKLKDTKETIRVKERKIEELTKTRNAIRQDGERVKADLMKKIKDKDGVVTKLQKTVEELRALCQGKEDKIGKLKTSVQLLEQEKESALNRLSAVMCARLRNDNPDIADLSDQYRPTELASICSELYDNQWTMAFETLNESLDERLVINILINVLMETQTFCIQMVDSHWQVLTTWFLSDTAVAGALETKQWLEESRKKHALKLLSSIQQDARKHIQAKFNLPFNPSIQKYVDECVRLCLMCSVQVPRVVLVEYVDAGAQQVTGSQPLSRRSTGNKHETHEEAGRFSSVGNGDIHEGRMKLDRNKYREYTCTGEFIEYVVWPALFIEKNWQMLSKGVAQGCK